MNVFINYNAKTLKVLGSYGEEENTPTPCIPVSIPDWNAAYVYGIDNLSVSKDLKSLVVDPTAKTKQDTDAANGLIKQQLADIDALSARALRSVMSATAQGKTPDSEDVIKLADYEAQAANLRLRLK